MRVRGSVTRGAFGLLAGLAFACALQLVSPAPAPAWFADFFDGDASGQAVYEDMSIHPQAVREGSTVYVVYQGKGLAPYLVAFDDGGGVRGPYRIGENPLASGWNPDDSHGAPSLLVDPDGRYLHVFWGSHVSGLQHARASIDDPSRWTPLPSVSGNVTYPQVFRDSTGMAHLFFRNDEDQGDPSEPERGSWLESLSADGGSTWSTPTVIVRGSAEISWYGHFESGAGGRVDAVLTAHQRALVSPYARRGVYFMRRESGGLWADVAGSALETSVGAGVTPASLASTATAAVVYSSPDENQNQLTVAEDPSGLPGILFASGNGWGPASHRFVFARWSGSEWASATVAPTDHQMDASALEYLADGSIDAYVTAGGTNGKSTASDPYSDRGGDIVLMHSNDAGASWVESRTIAAADLDQGIVYNDPQIVHGHDGGSRLLFGEWDNDAGNFIHKVFLWGPDGYRGREFFPEAERLGGLNRYETAVAISRAGFPNGADTVIVASGASHADALAGVPLANAYHAPLLLVPSAGFPPVVRDEVRRLKATEVIVLGGSASVSGGTFTALHTGAVKHVRRIGGADRYAVASAIASSLASKAGRSDLAFVVSGTAFADALSASPLAAVTGAPVLLVSADQVPRATADRLRSLGVTRTIVVGGPGSVSDVVLAALPQPVRVSGSTRYETSAALASLALDGGSGVPARSLRTDRPVVASGEVFADALAGGVLAARFRAPVLLTQGDELSSSAASWLDGRARRVIRCYFLGGTGTLSQGVAAQVSDVLRGHAAE